MLVFDSASDSSRRWPSPWVTSLALTGCSIILYHRIRRRQRKHLRLPPPDGRMVSTSSFESNATDQHHTKLPKRKQHIRVLGSSSTGPVVVFVHGFGCNSLEFETIAYLLSYRGYRVVLYDRVAYCGDCTPRYLPRTAEVLVNELRALLRNAVGVSTRVVLVGHSYGGLIGQMYAYKHPDEVEGMVLLDPAHEDQFGKPTPWDFALAFRLVPMVLGLYRFFAPLGVVRVLDWMSLVNFPPLFLYPKEQRDRARELYSDPSSWRLAAEELRGCYESYPVVRAARKVSSIGPPTRIVIAGKRRYSPTMYPDEVTRAFVEIHAPMCEPIGGQVDMVMAEESDHWIHLQEPDIVVEAVDHVCKKIDAKEVQ